MKPLDTFVFKPKKCLAELNKFDKLLAKKRKLDERKDVLPFFKRNRHLAAYIGSYLPKLIRFDKMKSEFEVFVDFRADLVVGDSKNNCYCMIEFEDAKKSSIFKSHTKSSPDWANRFEHGFSQLVDWFSMIDDMTHTKKSTSMFGNGAASFMGVLVIGRDQFLGQSEKDRLAWRVNNVTINTNKIVCVTYDQLARDLRDGLRLPIK